MHAIASSSVWRQDALRNWPFLRDLDPRAVGRSHRTRGGDDGRIRNMLMNTLSERHHGPASD